MELTGLGFESRCSYFSSVESEAGDLSSELLHPHPEHPPQRHVRKTEFN